MIMWYKMESYELFCFQGLNLNIDTVRQTDNCVNCPRGGSKITLFALFNSKFSD